MTESINNSAEFTTWLDAQSVVAPIPANNEESPSSYGWFLADGMSGHGVIDATALPGGGVSVEGRVSQILAFIGS
ncbi:MAG: hypothetical protein V3U76_09475 [Granulosicoccus sp.]